MSGTKEARPSSPKMIAIASFVIAIVIAACSWIVYEALTTTKVPQAQQTISSEKDNACKPFEKAALKCKQKLITDEKVSRFAFVKQSIEANSKVKKDTEVTIYYSKGPAEFTLTELRNETVDNAKAIVKKYGIAINEKEIVADSGLQADRIVTTTPKAGETVANGGSIDVVVSNGKITVPDWKGKAKELVDADSKEKSITVTFESVESDGPSGIVLSQSASGSVNMTDTVIVKISKAREAKEIAIPKVIGLTPIDAQVALATSGFTHINLVTVEKDGVKAEKVSAVNPGEGAKAKSDTVVILTVETPKKPTS